MPFRRAKTVVKCTYAWQFTGPRTIHELRFLEEREMRSQTQRSRRGTSDTPRKFIEVASLTEGRGGAEGCTGCGYTLTRYFMLASQAEGVGLSCDLLAS